MSNDLSQVLIKPLLSEKSYVESEMNKYRFAVQQYANRIEIRKAVEKMFGVKVLDVNIARVKGKKKRFGRFVTQKSDWKKAIVTLADGESLDFFEKNENL
ncbi:50S ribosomal protein L23 [bacterium]|jgi:large subunit ribosomal protein L23|nr:50S ribosomal protein L23 [bacterium]